MYHHCRYVEIATFFSSILTTMQTFNADADALHIYKLIYERSPHSHGSILYRPISFYGDDWMVVTGLYVCVCVCLSTSIEYIYYRWMILKQMFQLASYNGNDTGPKTCYTPANKHPFMSYGVSVSCHFGVFDRRWACSLFFAYECVKRSVAIDVDVYMHTYDFFDVVL